LPASFSIAYSGLIRGTTLNKQQQQNKSRSNGRALPLLYEWRGQLPAVRIYDILIIWKMRLLRYRLTRVSKL